MNTMDELATKVRSALYLMSDGRDLRYDCGAGCCSNDAESEADEALRALDEILERAALEDWAECAGAHETSEMLWPGTAHQGVVCRRCKVFLPC